MYVPHRAIRNWLTAHPTYRTLVGRLPVLAGLALSIAVASDVFAVPGLEPFSVQAQACSVNAIVCENQQTGNDVSEWDLTGGSDASIQGFTTAISVNKGETVRFKVRSTASAYRLDIYRMGNYSGRGARKVATVLPSVPLPQTQPACLTDSAMQLIDCGNWQDSATWQVPTTAVSGIYFAKLVRSDTGGASHVFWVVRDDSSHSDLLFQTADTSWVAYNSYGGSNLYNGPSGRAYKVSYNRPFNDRENGAGAMNTWVFNAEYPMVRWLEGNGYDVSYSTGIDSDRRGSLLLNHKAFVSVGHDEYWSRAQRDNIEAARNAGVSLAFFSGNEVFWKTRYENSIDGTNTQDRTLVAYKETLDNRRTDPLDPPTWTGTWRDPRFSANPTQDGLPVADGGRPENGLTGTIFVVNGPQYNALTVPAAYSRLRFWRNTPNVSRLTTGQTATLGAGCNCSLGYEWDSDVDNGFRPAGLMRMSSTTATVNQVLQDYGGTYASGTATHNLTLYRHASGALVFGAGTVQWSWGLDGNHDIMTSTPDPDMQQATVNLFADMGAQPGTLQAGLVPATASSDRTQPTSIINTPGNGATLTVNTSVTISGTAAKTGGVVAGVEVSTDGGTSWHPANGTDNWSYVWTPTVSGSTTIRARAVDDNGNLQNPGPSITVTVQGRQCPCSVWNPSTTPGLASQSDTSAVELGVKFRSDTTGYITGVRFYKGPANSGLHVGSLWSSTGSLLAQQQFSGETATGWQQVNFANPVQITANTTYVASYHTNMGGYSDDQNSFNTVGVDNAPLHVLSSPASGGNGVYTYDAAPVFPSNTYAASNYWVDVVFNTQVAPPPPPTISNVQSNAASNTATITWSTDIVADSQVEYGTTTAYGASTTVDPTLVTSHSVPLSNLTANTLYHYRVKSKNSAGVGTTSGDFQFTTTNQAQTTVTFDDLPNPNRGLDGQYPTGQINWGTGAWYLSGPWAQFTGNSVSFNGGGQTSATFTFLTAKRLISIQADNGGRVASTITLSCSGNPTKTQNAPIGQIITITTSWGASCTVVTVGSTNGWDTNLKNLVYDGG